MAGIKTLHYIDIKNITRFHPTGEGVTVTLIQSAVWSQVRFSSARCDTVPEGDAFRHTIEATVPGKGTVSMRDLIELRYGRYLVRVTDNNGIQWICGDDEDGLRFSFEDINEGNPNGETSYNLAFSGLSVWPQMKLN